MAASVLRDRSNRWFSPGLNKAQRVAVRRLARMRPSREYNIRNPLRRMFWKDRRATTKRVARSSPTKRFINRTRRVRRNPFM